MERFRFWGRLIGTDLSSAEEWPGGFNDGSEDLAVGIGFRHGDPDVADREADLGADLEELQANRLTLSASQGGLLSETTQGVHDVEALSATAVMLTTWAKS